MLLRSSLLNVVFHIYYQFSCAAFELLLNHTNTHTHTLEIKFKKYSISANISANTQESTLKIDLWYHCLLIRCDLILGLQLIDFEILDSHGAMWNHTSEGQSWHCCNIIWKNEMVLPFLCHW